MSRPLPITATVIATGVGGALGFAAWMVFVQSLTRYSAEMEKWPWVLATSIPVWTFAVPFGLMAILGEERIAKGAATSTRARCHSSSVCTAKL